MGFGIDYTLSAGQRGTIVYIITRFGACRIILILVVLVALTSIEYPAFATYSVQIFAIFPLSSAVLMISTPLLKPRNIPAP